MEPIGLVAVVLSFSVPLAAIYAWYRVRKLRTEERLAAIAKGEKHEALLRCIFLLGVSSESRCAAQEL